MSRSVQWPPIQGRGYSVRALMSVGAGSGPPPPPPRPAPRPPPAARLLARHRALLIDRRGDARARDLGEEAYLVVPPAAPRHRPLPVVGVGRVVDDAFLAGGLEGGSLGLPEDAVPAVDERVHVRVDRIGGRHDEDARGIAAHLVLVEPHRREPVAPQQARRVLALLLREHVHVAVVVVPDVGVVEIRDAARLERRPEVLVEPVGHEDLPVRIQARHQQEDDVIENLLHLRRVLGRQAVHQFHRHLRGADLGRVNAARDEQHELAVPEDVIPLGVGRRPSLEIQFPLQGLVAIQVLQRLGRADLHHDEGIAVG